MPNEPQHDLFGEVLPATVNPTSEFAQFRVVEQNKIIHVPRSKWKDGRIRGDLSKFGAGEVVSRNEKNFQDEVIRRLQEKFDAVIVEVVSDVSEELRRDRARPARPARPSKRALKAITPTAYINPFAEDKSLRFGKYPDWLLACHDLKPQEILIYGRLLFPLPPICKSFDKNLGVIIGLNQGELANAFRKSRQWANEWIIKLQAKGWLECIGPQGAKQVTRFPWKQGMPETCQTYQHVSAAKPAPQHSSACLTSQQEHATPCAATCHTSQHVSQGIEKRETKRKEREDSQSLGWGS
jgi:hypothetical protein